MNLMNALDSMESPLWTGNGAPAQSFAYAPYGGISPDHHADGLLPGFNGERLDPISLTYHLGNGYRTYSPTLMRFNAPDSWSPFGAGGLNAYAYCEGDPVNRSDPSGHLSGHAIAGMTLAAIGLLLDIVTDGLAIAAEGSIAAAWAAASATDIAAGIFGPVADLTAIASGAASASNPKIADVLGWVSLSAGLTGGLLASSTILSRSTYARYRRARRRTAMLSDGQGIELVELNTPKPRSNPHGQRNLRLHPEGFSTFEDGPDGEGLTIHNHGGPGELGGPTLASRMQMPAEDLHQLLQAQHLYDGHSRLRVFSCHSADRPSKGGMSLAEHLAEYSGLPTEGFHGGAYAKNVMAPGVKSVYRQFQRTETVPTLSRDMQQAMARGPYYRGLTSDPRNRREIFWPSWRQPGEV